MLSKKKTSGYCPACHKNVPHRRRFSSRFTRLLDNLSLSILRLFRIGPWFCVHCDKKSLFLAGRRSDALDYRSAALGNEQPVATRKQTKPVLKSQIRKPEPEAQKELQQETRQKNPQKPQPKPTATKKPVASPDPKPAAQPIGNFLKSDRSLTNRKHRLERFSEKYRDAVVRRILAGTATISQIRNDKQLSETEIAEWIADLFDRREKKIEQLERIVNSISNAKLKSAQTSRPGAQTQTKPR